MLLLEPFYLLNVHLKGGMDWTTYYNFNIVYRRWLIERIGKDLEAKAQQLKEKQQGPQLVSNGAPARVPNVSSRKF